jgi:hypothetical protein
MRAGPTSAIGDATRLIGSTRDRGEVTRDGGDGVRRAVPSPKVLIFAVSTKAKLFIPSIGDEITISFLSDGGCKCVALEGRRLRAPGMSAFGVVSAGVSTTDASFIPPGVIVFADDGVWTLRLELRLRGKGNAVLPPSVGEMAEAAIGVDTAFFEFLSLHPKNRPTEESTWSAGDMTLSFSSSGFFSKFVISFRGEFFGVIRNVARGFVGLPIGMPLM